MARVHSLLVSSCITDHIAVQAHDVQPLMGHGRKEFESIAEVMVMLFASSERTASCTSRLRCCRSIANQLAPCCKLEVLRRCVHVFTVYTLLCGRQPHTLTKASTVQSLTPQRPRLLLVGLSPDNPTYVATRSPSRLFLAPAMVPKFLLTESHELAPRLSEKLFSGQLVQQQA